MYPRDGMYLHEGRAPMHLNGLSHKEGASSSYTPADMRCTYHEKKHTHTHFLVTGLTARAHQQKVNKTVDPLSCVHQNPLGTRTNQVAIRSLEGVLLCRAVHGDESRPTRA